MAVAVLRAAPASIGAAKPAFDTGARVPLFDTHIAVAPGTSAFQYDVTKDGKRFLVATNTSSAASAPTLTVLVNWTGK